MKSCYIIQLGPAERPAIADVDIHYGPGECYINRINVPQPRRGEGHARELLRQILEDADKASKVLFLEPQASDGLTDRQLRAWYQRHGFREFGVSAMRRLPHDS